MTFSPIAIIGRGCVLPEALDITQFNELVMNGRQALCLASEQEWQADIQNIVAELEALNFDMQAIRTGGLVRGFDSVFDPSGLMLEPPQWQGDVITRWLIHAGRQALREAGFASLHDLPKTGMIMGNLSYPTMGHGRFGFQALLQRQRKHLQADRLFKQLEQQAIYPTDRFSTALPVITAARALACTGESFALDAACASSLYAIKLACDRLQQHECDLMLAGGVNHVDNLVMHLGFAALGAHSHSGRSLPFQQEADGLLPSEGAAMVALCRLEDAMQHDWSVLGVVRGVGLANDGNRGGFLQPDSAGQARALRRAYQQAGIDPASVSYVECHATGTLLGDRTELQTLQTVYKDVTDLPIGSLKANLGHLITVAGGAGLLKLLAALQTKTLPHTPVSGSLVTELETGPFRLLTANEPWQQASPRRAGLNAFGFGGSNAHLILEEWCEARWHEQARPKSRQGAKPAAHDMAIISMAVRSGEAQSTGEFVAQLFDKASSPQPLAGGGLGFPAPDLQIDLKQVKTPPNDLRDTLGQHIQVLLTALEAMQGIPFAAERTGIYIGMGCDSEMSRHVVRWRLGYLLRQLNGEDVDPGWLEEASKRLMPKCRAAHILGAMPNMPANRINHLLNIQGPGFTLGAEENSGLAALHTAQLALQTNEIDIAIVGAVDLSCESIHQSAAAQLLPANRQISGDATTVLVLRRLQDARADGDEIIALIPSQVAESDNALTLSLTAAETGLSARFGHAHACSGLLMVAAAAAAVKHGAYLHAEKYAIPWLNLHKHHRSARVMVSDLAQQQRQLCLQSAEATASGFDPDDLQLHCYAADDRAGLIECLQKGRVGGEGTVRLAMVGCQTELPEKIQTAIAALRAGREPAAEACFFSTKAVEGEVAFVFNGIAASYSGVSRELSMAVPQLFARLEQRCDTLDVFPHVLEPGYNALSMTPLEQIFASIMYGQLHTEWTRGIAAIQPHAMLGISAGETNSLFASGVWQDLGGMFRKLVEWDIFDEALSHRFDVVEAAWRKAGVLLPTDEMAYSSWRVFHPVDEILARIGEVEPLVRVSIIHSDQDCIVVGQPAACKAFLDQLGARALSLGAGISIHTPDIAAYAKNWYQFHHWPTRQVETVRLYSNAHRCAYTPTRDAVAEALTQQATNPIDFRPTVRQAWADGVRIFVEHGARNLCSNWISDILGDQAHLCLAMDVAGKNSYQQALEVIAQLWSVQVPVDLAAVHAAMPVNRYQKPDHPSQNASALFSMPAHLPEVIFPPLPDTDRQRQTMVMSVAPPLPLTTDHWQASVQLLTVPPLVSRPATSVNTQAPLSAAVVDHRFEAITAMHQSYLQSIADVSANMAHSLMAFHQLVGGRCTGQR